MTRIRNGSFRRRASCSVVRGCIGGGAKQERTGVKSLSIQVIVIRGRIDTGKEGKNNEESPAEGRLRKIDDGDSLEKDGRAHDVGGGCLGTKSEG